MDSIPQIQSTYICCISIPFHGFSLHMYIVYVFHSADLFYIYIYIWIPFRRFILHIYMYMDSIPQIQSTYIYVYGFHSADLVYIYLCKWIPFRIFVLHIHMYMDSIPQIQSTYNYVYGFHSAALLQCSDISLTNFQNAVYTDILWIIDLKINQLKETFIGEAQLCHNKNCRK